MNQELKTFYDLAKDTRAGVLDWLETLPPEVFTLEHEQFAYGSLRNIYAHIADCYLWWVGAVGLGLEQNVIKAKEVSELREAFSKLDATINEALGSFDSLDEPFSWTSPKGYKEILTRRWLILHPITHEFHHKGQALALARVLGHSHPGNPDTDLVTPKAIGEIK
ncbi:MAG: DinB family protein [Trueperaceae bacterium]|nr:DinB family protein [Trueperaceae bacterium]